MENLFKKTVFLTDQHFGRGGNNPIANQDSFDFIEWAIDRAKSWDAETCILGGDLFDNRHSIGVLTINRVLEALDRLAAAFKRLFIIIGNHDMPYRERRDSVSIELARNYANVVIIREPTTIGNVTFLPWLVGDEYKTVKQISSRYIFGHLAIAGFVMNGRMLMPDGDHVVKPDFFSLPEYIFSGHFHQRQFQKSGASTVLYAGSCFPTSFSDADDTARGAMLLQWGCDPVFEAWPEQPLYHATTLSKLLDDLAVLRPRMTVRAAIDIDLHYDEAQEMRETLMTGYGLRKLELSNAAPVDTVQADTSATLHTVDQIVIDGLRGIESTGLSSDRLIEIFTNLPRR
jgi:hypothetical protein